MIPENTKSKNNANQKVNKNCFVVIQYYNNGITMIEYKFIIVLYNKD